MINHLMREAIKFFLEQNFYLPPFAYWTLQDWQKKGGEIREIIDNQLKWDITDFGSGNFLNCGLLLFTIRNGALESIPKGGKNFCEKIMIVEEGQITPMHHHYQKTEDIINRSGGKLLVQIYKTTKNDKLSNALIHVSLDGIQETFEPGSIIELEPGDSITLKPEIYHKFWAKEGSGKVLVGEVSSVNDDRVDNKFLEELGRFAEIEEDEPPLYLLYRDYEKYVHIK
jgi:hypothetical protein